MPAGEPAASGEVVKVCNACGQGKPLGAFYGPYTDMHTGRQRWKGTCKACMAGLPVQADGATKRDLARERRLRDFLGSKTCTGCGEEKPLADFGRPSLRDQAGGRVALAFKPQCLACQSKVVRARRARKGAP